MSNLIRIITNNTRIERLHEKKYWTFLKKHGELIATLLSGIIILTAWILEDNIPNSLWITFNLLAFIIGGFAKAKEGITNSIQYKELNVELLMFFAAIGSALIGYWTEGAILIFIFALSGALETYTMQKSERELSALMDIQPDQALRVIHNKTELVDIEDLVIGDYILIKPGERIPADGTITKGKSSIDESALTGESIPVTKQSDADVYAGTVNLNGSLTVEISKLSKDSFVQKIMELVQSAQSEKSPSQLFIERFESTYVKIVLITVAVMLFLPHFLFGWSWTDTIYRAMILLVVASPCALAASIMPATLSAISNAARSGILFKGGVHIENLSNVKAIAFDKTGTLTNGTPHVTDIHFAKAIDEHHALQVITAIESESTHPLAQAIVTYTKKDQRKSDLLVENMQEEVGKGVSSTVDGDNWMVGSGNFFRQRTETDWYNDIAEKLASEAKTVVYIAKNNEVVGLIALKDDVRADTIKAIQSFKKAGIHTIMLTGDNETTAQAIAEEAHLDGYIANCMPADKVTEIKKLKEKYNHVAMIGDGINDAPALAIADIGIAMGAGTDVALETADIILIKNKLKKITNAIQLSTRMNRIVKQNIFFSISVIFILIITNFFQLVDLPLGVLGHEGSTILVILNGLRLLR